MSADQFYPFGGHVGDKELTTGYANSRHTSSKVALTPAFRFFSNVEDTLWVSELYEYPFCTVSRSYRAYSHCSNNSL